MKEEEQGVQEANALWQLTCLHIEHSRPQDETRHDHIVQSTEQQKREW